MDLLLEKIAPAKIPTPWGEHQKDFGR